MDQFMTWEMLGDYAIFVLAVFEIVAVTKNAWMIKDIPTRVWSIIVAFILLTVVDLHAGTFKLWNIVMHLLNGIFISLNANGLADINQMKGGVSDENKSTDLSNTVENK